MVYLWWFSSLLIIMPIKQIANVVVDLLKKKKEK